jgi:hypothetical protein
MMNEPRGEPVPTFIIAAGTLVVLKAAKTVPGSDQVKPAGSVAEVVESPVKKAKSLVYAYRVVLTGLHLLQTGEVEANLPTLNERFRLPFIDDLIARKQAREQGELTELDWTWHRDELTRWEGQLDQAFADSKLPEEPPREELHRFLVDVRLDAFLRAKA